MKVTAKFTASSGCSENSKPEDHSGRKYGLDTESWTYRFKCDGRTYKLFKRNKSRDGAWEIDVTIKGRRIQRSMETNNADAAASKASIEFIRPARGGNWEKVEGTKAKESFSNIGAVVAEYKKHSVGELDEGTVKQNLNSLYLVVRRGLDKESMEDAAVDLLSTGVLTGKLASDFESWMKRAAVATGKNLESNKRTVIAYLRCARSIFKDLNMPKYKDAGLRLPNLDEFKTRAVASPARLVHVPPSDELLRKTFEALPALRESDRPAYIAWLLGLTTLRRKEIWYLEFSWAQRLAGRDVIVVPKEIAKSGADRVVPVDARVMMELEAWRVERQKGLNPEEEKYVLPSPYKGNGGPHAKQRGRCVTQRVSEWMRALGWTTRMTLHKMRAVGLSWLRDDYGLDVAQAVAGHADQKTTQGSYVGTRAVKGIVVTLPLQIPVASVETAMSTPQAPNQNAP